MTIKEVELPIENAKKLREEKFLAIMEDVSEVIVKHFPNFDNNIEPQTWGFLILFVEETIQQLEN